MDVASNAVSLVIRTLSPLLGLALSVLSVPTFAASEELVNNATIVCDGNEKNRDTYLQMWKVLFMERDGARAGEFYASELLSHNVDHGGNHVRTVTPADLAKMWERSKALEPERVLEDELILCAGDFVTVRTTVHSADNRGIAGYPPTGRTYSTTAIDIYRFENGKVVERWGNVDHVSRFNQTGFVVVPKELAAKLTEKP